MGAQDRWKSYSRREYLSAVAIPLLGGCLSGDESIPGLGRITVYNSLDREIEFTVSVLRDDERVHEDEYSLEPVTDAVIDGIVVDEEWAGENDRYEIIVDVSDIGKGTYTTADFLEMAGETDDIQCFEVSAHIEDDIIDFFPTVRDECPT